RVTRARLERRSLEWLRLRHGARKCGARRPPRDSSRARARGRRARMTFRHEAFLTLVAVLAALGLAGCGSAETPKDVVLVTHDSFVVSKSVREEFERETGLRWRILQSGDAGRLSRTPSSRPAIPRAMSSSGSTTIS